MPRISGVRCTTTALVCTSCTHGVPMAKFSCTPRVQEVHTKAEVVLLIPGLLGLGVLFNIQHRKCIAKHMINPSAEILVLIICVAIQFLSLNIE